MCISKHIFNFSSFIERNSTDDLARQLGLLLDTHFKAARQGGNAIENGDVGGFVLAGFDQLDNLFGHTVGLVPLAAISGELDR